MWTKVMAYTCGTECLSLTNCARRMRSSACSVKTFLLNVQEENGGIAQSVERSLCKREVQRSKLCASKKFLSTLPGLERGIS